MPRKKHSSRLEDHAGYWLRYASNHVSQAFARKVEAQGVTVAEWVLLRQMHESGTTNPSLLAQSIGMTRGAVSKLVERVCQKKLAIRTHSELDRRYQTVELTESGKQLVPILAKLADENDEEFFGHLQADEKTWLIDILQDMVRRHGWKEIPVG